LSSGDNTLEQFKHGDIGIEEAHRRLAFGGRKCDHCEAPAAIRVRLFGDAKEVVSRHADWVMREAARNNGTVPVVDFTYGKFIRISEAYACDSCKSELEREAAKAPDWCIVEFDRGKKDQVQLQVPPSYQKETGGGNKP